jgi:hypothetical protein
LLLSSTWIIELNWIIIVLTVIGSSSCWVSTSEWRIEINLIIM